jgi:hypothetical protein
MGSQVVGLEATRYVPFRCPFATYRVDSQQLGTLVDAFRRPPHMFARTNSEGEHSTQNLFALKYHMERPLPEYRDADFRSKKAWA